LTRTVYIRAADEEKITSHLGLTFTQKTVKNSLFEDQLFIYSFHLHQNNVYPSWKYF
jgi:hypothetical protein